MSEPTYQIFTSDDIKKILATQSAIQIDVALAGNNLKWIVENYQNQCKVIDGMQQTCSKLDEKYNALKGDVIKYNGIAIGVMTVISLLITAINLGFIHLPWK